MENLITHASSPRSRIRWDRLTGLATIFAVWGLAAAPCLAASGDRPTVRRIGKIEGVLVRNVRSQVRIARFDSSHGSPILVQGEKLGRLKDTQKAELAATYQAGFAIVLLEASLEHIRTLHTIVGEGVSYRSKDTGGVMAYTLRRVNFVPTATLLANVDRSPLKTPQGGPDPRGVQDEKFALDRAVERAIGELTQPAQPGEPGAPRDPNQEANWLSLPIQTTTFSLNSPQGIYNTSINVYALFRCLDLTDHYAVTAGADWTATQALWQGVTSADPNPSLYLDSNNKLVTNWQDGRTYCSSGGVDAGFDDICRYINYPLYYEFTLTPRAQNVVQLNAAPAATQGQQSSYSSGFTFSIAGTVNVSAQGPGAGFSVGASWTNTVTTNVPPLIVEVSDTANEGVNWKFKYCTTGLEPDPGTDCTGHVQMVKDVCQAQLGDDVGGTNPQQGQTSVGKFSDAVQSAHWQTASANRVGTTFDIDVGFNAAIAITEAHLGDGTVTGPDPIAGCNYYGCECVSTTVLNPVTKSFTFEIPYPSTKCTP